MQDSECDGRKSSIDHLRKQMQDLEKRILSEFETALKIRNAEAYLKVDGMIEDYLIIKTNYLYEVNRRREFL